MTENAIMYFYWNQIEYDMKNTSTSSVYSTNCYQIVDKSLPDLLVVKWIPDSLIRLPKKISAIRHISFSATKYWNVRFQPWLIQKILSSD